MKRLWGLVRNRSNYWKPLLVFLFCICLAGRTDPVNLYESIDVSRANQSVSFDFDVSQKGEYQFALLFAIGYTGYNDDEVRQRFLLFGNANNSGEIIPVSLRLVKDGKLFLDEKIDSEKIIRSHEFYRGEGRISTVARNIKTLTLPAGHYSATITALKDIPTFDEIGAFVQIVYYTPENLARIDKQTQATEQKMGNDWYNLWRLTKKIVHGLYCLTFCPEHTSIYKPIDVSQTGNSATIDFDVKEKRYYQFSLLFEQGDDYDEMKRRDRLFDDAKNGGVIIPVSIHLVKDGAVFYDRKISKAGSSWGGSIYYENREVSVAGRNIKVLELPPGHYSLIVTVLEGAPAFNAIESFVSVY